MRYFATGGQLEVYLDEMSDPVLAATALSLAPLLDADGAAYVGFTAATADDAAGAHELLDWRLASLDSLQPPGPGGAVSVSPEKTTSDVISNPGVTSHVMPGKRSVTLRASSICLLSPSSKDRFSSWAIQCTRSEGMKMHAGRPSVRMRRATFVASATVGMTIA